MAAAQDLKGAGKPRRWATSRRLFCSSVVQPSQVATPETVDGSSGDQLLARRSEPDEGKTKVTSNIAGQTT